MTITGHSATFFELEEGMLTVQEVGHSQLVEADTEQEDFLTHLMNYNEEWCWEDTQTPDVTE